MSKTLRAVKSLVEHDFICELLACQFVQCPPVPQFVRLFCLDGTTLSFVFHPRRSCGPDTARVPAGPSEVSDVSPVPGDEAAVQWSKATLA